MEHNSRLGQAVCIFRGYTVIEVLEDGGTNLVGFSVFGPGVPNTSVFATPEEAMRAVDARIDGSET